jgi:hypothetical protein
MMITSNVTQGTTTVTGSVSTQTITYVPTFTASFTSGGPSTHDLVSDSQTDKYMIFTTSGQNHVFNIPSGGLNCDILMIGGGGGVHGYYGGAGAGACIVAINQTLPVGQCIVYVGDRGSALNTNGGDSYIQVAGGDRYRAKGGATRLSNGGCGSGAGSLWAYGVTSRDDGSYAVNTNVVTLSSGLTSNIGPCLNSIFAVLGNKGGANEEYSGNSTSYLSGYANAGGGGIGEAGLNHPLGQQGGSRGGNGAYQVTLSGSSTPINFRSYFANGSTTFGVQDGSTGNYYIGGGGAGYTANDGYPKPLGGLGGGAKLEGNGGSGYPNTGSGGSSSGVSAESATSHGGTGIVIIRYRSLTPTTTTTTTTTYTHTSNLTTTLSTPTLGTPSIELVRGTQGDSNTDYKIGNYNGDFIVKSSVSSTDTDFIKILGTDGTIYNKPNSLYWNQISDRRIKENIMRASYDMCYDNVDKLELNRFNYIKEFNTGNRDTNHLGFIAQEIKEIFPKAVFTNNYNSGDLNIQDMLSIDIGQINFTLYGAVKKLMEINKDKELRLKRLECLLNVECGSGSGGSGSDSGGDSGGDNVVIDSDISIDTSNLLETSNIIIDTSNITIDSSNIAIDTSNIILDTSNIILETSNIVIDTSDIILDTSNITIDTSNIVIDTSNITIDTSNIVIDTSNVLDTSSNI